MSSDLQRGLDACESRCQYKAFGFYCYENSPNRSNPAIKVRRLGTLQICEKETDPRGQGVLQQLPICAWWALESAAHQAGHDFTEYGCMILWFVFSIDAL